MSAAANAAASAAAADALDPTLPQKFARAERIKKWRAFAPVAPLLLFIVFAFLAPVASMLWRSVDNAMVGKNLPQTAPLLKAWSGDGLPSDETFAAMLADIRAGDESKTITRLGQRLNYEASGFSSLFRKSARRVRRLDEPAFASPAAARAALLGIDKKWGQEETWRVIKKYSPAVVGHYYAAAFDFIYDPQDDQFERLPEKRRIYMDLFGRTVVLSLLVTLMTLLLAYPTAFLLATLPSRSANILLIFVLLPFWTSLLVRTTSWIVLLQQQGVVNELLVNAGLLASDNRLQLIHNATGTVIAMTHILLPFMVLPLYSVMKSVSPSYMRAARSLGAGPLAAFWRVYFPQTLPGIGAGGILVFILSIGYYITPALVGGTSGTFISNRIAYHISSSLNWGLASALGFMLLLLVVAMFLLYDRLVGSDKMRLG
jgi:putative spermidine/putrescine transport system permease protein